MLLEVADYWNEMDFPEMLNHLHIKNTKIISPSSPFTYTDIAKDIETDLF